MPSGTLENGLEERPTLSGGHESPLSSGRPQKAMAPPTLGESEAFASLLGLYLAHELKATRMPGRHQESNTNSDREEVSFFDRAALNKFIKIAKELYRENVISAEQYSNAILVVTSMYIEQNASFMLDSSLQKVSRYIGKAFRGVPL
jgi:hypothetical protein